ncbi:MAG: acyltransferase [Candidatus Brocadiaceae bacterium]|nr:acyltransferase [Candidatus Brocadiaceae bacterium]
MLSRGTIALGCNVKIEDFSDLRGKIILGDNIHIHRYVVLRSFEGTIEIGVGTTVNPFTTIYGNGGVKIGKHCSIATKCTIVAQNHKFKNIHKNIKEQGSSSKGIVIEDDVWIGSNTVILDGVRIESGAIVGAGAVVTKNVNRYSVVGGVPAKVINHRLSK